MSAVAALPAILDDDRMGELLSLWSRWMSSSQHLRELWYPDQAAGCVGGGYSNTFEDMIDESDRMYAAAVNGAIEGLRAIEQAAIYHFHLAAVYRFGRPVDGVYENARYSLRVVLPQRGIY